MKILPSLFFIALGFVLCALLSWRGCISIEAPVKDLPQDTLYVQTFRDTFHTTYVTDTVVRYKTKYVPVTTIQKVFGDTLFVYEDTDSSGIRSNWIDLGDSTQLRWAVDSGSMSEPTIPVRTYQDSLISDQYNIQWEASVLGTLIDISHLIEFKKDSTVHTEARTVVKKTNWVVEAGVSNRLGYKGGLGFKGWKLEAEFRDKRLDEVYFTRQFRF
jgi:hypothetical protein